MTLAGKRPRRLYRLLVRTEMLKSVAPWLLVLLISDIASSAPLTQLHRDTGTSCSHLIPVLLKSEGSVANQCSPVAEWSAERRAIIEAVTIEFVPAIKDTSWLSSITLEAMGEHGPAEVSLFTGKVNRTTTTVDVSLKPKLSGVTKVKVHSFPPERCIKATLWVCYDPITETKGDRLDPCSMHSVGGSQQVINKDNPTNRRRQVQDGDDSNNLANSWRVLTEHRVKRAAGNAASSVTTPRTYSWLQAAIVGCISVISMAVLPSLFIALLCCNRKKNQSREKDKKLIISEKSPPFTSTNNPMDAPSMSSLDKLGECKSSIDGDLNGSVYDLATPTVSTFHSVHSNAISLTNILDASSVNSTPSKVPPPPQVSTPSSSNSTHSHPKLRRISQQVQTVDMQFKSPLTPPSSDTKAPPMPNVLQLAPPPAAKPRSSRVVVTNSTDDLLYCPDDKGETNSFTTFKTLQKPPAKRTLTNDSVSSMGSESLISYVLTPEMLAGGQRSRSGTIESLQSQSSAFSDISAAQKRTSTGSNLQYQQYLSPSAAAAGRGNRSSLCEEQLISSSAIVEVRQSGLVHNQNVVKSDTGADQNSLPLKLPKHLRVDQSRPFSIAAGCLPEETDFAVLGITSESATAVDTEETKSSSLTSSTIRFLRSQLWSQSSQDESTLDRGTRSRHSSSGVIHSREGSEVFDDSVETASLNSPCRASPKALNKRAKKINKKKRKPVMSPPRTPPPLPPTPPPPSSLSPGPPTFPHAPPTPPPPSSLPPGPPTFPYGPSTSPPLSSLPPRPPTLSPPIPPPPSSLPPGPPTFPHAPPMPPPPSSLPPGPPTFPHAPSTPPPPLSLPPGPPTRPFPPPTPPPRAKRTGNSNNVEVNAIRNSIESDLGDFETVKPAQEEHSVCISCGIRIDESTTTQQGQSEDPVYLRVLPDGDHESCSVDVTDASKAVDTTDADTHTADPTDSKQKKKLLRKEDSVPSYHLLEQGRLICMDCLNRDGPIYHELEVVQSDSELLAEDPTPPIPPRPRPLKPKDPIYERVASLNRNQHLQARKFSQSSEEGSYITTVARKPRSLHLGSSSDYESVPSQTNTSPFFQPNISAQQLAAKFEQRDKQSEPLPSPPPPPPHRNRPHPPPLAKLRGEDEHSTSSHDYESVSSFEHSRVKRKVSDHDYAHIGPAPSLESLDEPLSSPPYIPDGATRAKLLKIDSQGYATVIPAGDVLDSDEVDCLQFSDGEECPINPSQLSCRDDDNWREQRENGYAPLTPQRRRESSKSAAATFSKQGGDEDECRDEPPPSPPLSTTPQDYEVPMNILQLSPIRSRDSTVVSPKLTRQRAVSSTSDAETKRLSLASKSGGDVVQEEEKLENGEAIVEVKSHDEVFDSGIETSVDSQDVRTATGSKDSSGSKCDELKQENHDELTTDHSSSNGSIRPRSMTVHAMVMSEHQNGGDGQNCNGSQFQKDGSSLYRKQTSMPSLLPPKALHISLDQNRHAIV